MRNRASALTGGASLVILVAAVLVMRGQDASAATFAVTRTDDPVPDGCSPADCSLREAIIAANAEPGADVIELGSGTYQLAIQGEGEDGAATGDLDIASAITVEGTGSITAETTTPTKIDGAQLDAVFHVLPGGSLALRDLTVRNGRGEYAGGIYAAGPLELDGVIIEANTGRDPGDQTGGGDWTAGGVWTSALFTMEGSYVVNNTATGGYAVGGIYSEIQAPEQRERPARSKVDAQGESVDIITIRDSTISENAAVDAPSGAGGVEIYVRDYDLTVRIDNTVISSNTASGGDNGIGGLYIADSGDLFLTDSQILNNSATDYSGTGGVYAYSYLYMNQTTIDGNRGGEDGAGGLYEDYYTEATNSTISNNSAGAEGGGGVYIDSELHLINSTVSGNSAGMDGAGGIYNYDYLFLRNSTIAANTGGYGGIYNGWNVYTTNSIIADNTPQNCEMYYEPEDEGDNLEDANTCGLDGSLTSRNEDPLLGPLANNGGPTLTHALMEGSPAIDKGTKGCPEPLDYYGDPYTAPVDWPRDQRGGLRPAGKECDIGAYEAGSAPPTPTPSPTPPGTERVFGDINCNSTADSVDALVVQRHLASLPVNQTQPCPGIGDAVNVVGGSEHPWGDVDCDGDVDTVDSLKLQRFVAALPVAQEDGCPLIGTNVLVQK